MSNGKSMNLRLALLVADVPAPELLAENGDYVKMFTELFQQAAAAMAGDVKIELRAFHVVHDEFPAEEDLTFDAYVITGAKYSAYDDLPWIQKLKSLVRAVLARKKPPCWLFGICFGHQVIAEAMGGKVSKNPRGWEVGWTEIQLNERGQEVLATGRQSFAVHQMHQDEVSVVPEHFEVLASTPVSACQVMVLPGRCLSIQAHPEFKSQYVKGLVVMRTGKKIFTEQQHDQWMRMVENPVDGLWFARKCLSMMLGRVVADS